MTMSNLIQTAEKEILRKEILNLCYQASPVGCSTDVLVAAFAHSGASGRDREEIVRQVDYLRSKGLVTVEAVGNERLNLSRDIVKLTPDGTDYLEGNTGQIAGIGG